MAFFVATFRFVLNPSPKFICCFHSSNSRSYSQFHDETEHNLVSLFNSLLHQNPTPPIFKFGKILGSLVKENHYSTAISLHRQMEFKGIASNLVTSNILINVCQQLGQNSFSLSVFANILKKGYEPDTITLTALIKGLCLKGDIHQALHFHDKVAALGFQLNQVSYSTLINGLCKVGETKLPCSC